MPFDELVAHLISQCGAITTTINNNMGGCTEEEKEALLVFQCNLRSGAFAVKSQTKSLCGGGGGGGNTRSMGGGGRGKTLGVPKKGVDKMQKLHDLIRRYEEDNDVSAGLAMLRRMVEVHSNHPNWGPVSSELLLSIQSYQSSCDNEAGLSSDLDAALTWLESQTGG